MLFFILWNGQVDYRVFLRKESILWNGSERAWNFILVFVICNAAPNAGQKNGSSSSYVWKVLMPEMKAEDFVFPSYTLPAGNREGKSIKSKRWRNCCYIGAGPVSWIRWGIQPILTKPALRFPYRMGGNLYQIVCTGQCIGTKLYGMLLSIYISPGDIWPDYMS